MQFSRVFTLTLIIISFGFSLHAQPLTGAKYEDQIEAGDTSMYNGDFINAYEWYDKAYKQSKDRGLAAYKAMSQYGYRDYKRAEKSYERIFRRDKKKQFESLRIDYANILVHNEKYSEALKEIETILANEEDEYVINQAKNLKAGIMGMDQYSDNLEAAIGFLEGVNSPNEEYSPVEYIDGTLYFASFNRKDMITLDGNEEGYECKIYTTSVNKDGEYEKPQPLGEHINRPGFHCANVSFNKEGTVMYFTRSKITNAQAESTRIWRSRKNESGWSAAEELPTVNGEWFATHPMEGELFGNKVLFFSADIPGGYGDLDLYYATIQGDDFATPVNLGERINTAYSEQTPFYSDGTLYFSSDGYPGLGGLDIQYSTWDGAVWSPVSNMGFNYNSSVDDMYYRSNFNGTTAYLVSNRPNKKKRKIKSETCCTDIYAVSIRDIVVDLLALVKDENGPLFGATVELMDNSVDQAPPVSKTNVTTNDFSFILESDRDYSVVFTKEGYYPDTITFNTIGILDDYTVKKTVTLKAMPVEEETEVITINEPIRLNNIYYDFDKWDILPDAEDDLDYLIGIMDEYPEIVIELSSHTDARGVSTYNRNLSQKRAESAKYYMVSNGIDPERVKPVGYGEDVILNQCKNGVKCSDEEHRLNRRTEFKIIEGPQTITVTKNKK